MGCGVVDLFYVGWMEQVHTGVDPDDIPDTVMEVVGGSIQDIGVGMLNQVMHSIGTSLKVSNRVSRFLPVGFGLIIVVRCP